MKDITKWNILHRQFAVAILTILILIFSIAHIIAVSKTQTMLGIKLPGNELLNALVLAELSAKLAILTTINFGKEATEGIGEIFIRNKSTWKFLIAIVISFAVAILISGILSIILLSGMITGLVLNRLSIRTFGSTTGDTMGAANECARAIALLIFSAVI